MNLRPGTLGRVVGSAWWALRAHASSSRLIIVAGAAAHVAVLPIALLGAPGSRRLLLAPLPDFDLGIGLTGLAWTPAASQHGAVLSLQRLLGTLGTGVLALSVLTVLALAAARASARRSEIVVRRAVGATRWQLRVAGLADGFAMAVAAVALGVPLGVVATRVALAAWPGHVNPGTLFAPTAAVMLGVAAAIMVGAMLPMLSVRRIPRVTRSAIPHGWTIPALQLGLSLAILVAAAQLVRHVSNRLSEPRGAAHRGQIFQIGQRAHADARAVWYASLLHRLGAGGFDVVSLSSLGTLAGLGTVDVLTADCGHCSSGGLPMPLQPTTAAIHAISADTFRAMGVRLLRGRGIGDRDAWHAPRVAVVNQAMAGAHFEYGIAVGRTIQLGRGPGSGWFTVIGVVEDRTPTALGAAFQPPYAVYVSALQLPPTVSELLVRPRASGGNVETAERTVRASLGAAGTVSGHMGELERRDVEAAPIAWFGRWIRLEGFGVLAIAVLGMFAVMQLWVRAMAPELAVRRAVGARRRQIVSYVLVRAVMVALVGVVIGLWIGQLTSGGLASAIPGLPPRDLSLVLGPAIALVAAALAGALIPAVRAARAAPAPVVAGLES